MIDHKTFKKLRLSDFISPIEIHESSDWEFEDKKWYAETYDFTEFLRPHERQQELHAIALDLAELDEDILEQILKTIDAPFYPGQTLEELYSLLGEVDEVQTFVEDRKTYNYLPKTDDDYFVSLTILNEGGLIYANIIVPPYHLSE